MFIVYKTTNLVNQKIYVGQHNTSADDGYLGSGLLLERAIEKYGVENFKRSTIEFCTSSNNETKEILSQKRKEYFLNNIEDISKYKYILEKDGEKFEFFNLKTFCKNNKGFNISGIIGAIRNNRKYKGWKILKILR